MKLSGKYKLNINKEIVWISLNDPNILKQCIPGCEFFEKESDAVFNAKATNQIGPMNASFSGKINLTNIKENQSYTLSGEGQSTVGFVNGSADINLSEKSGTTILKYEVNVNIGGKIAQLGSRLIDGVAKKMANYFFGRFADIVAPIEVGKDESNVGLKSTKVRVKKLKSNFLNKYIYSAIIIFILLSVVISYFVSR